MQITESKHFRDFIIICSLLKIKWNAAKTTNLMGKYINEISCNSFSQKPKPLAHQLSWATYISVEQKRY